MPIVIEKFKIAEDKETIDFYIIVPGTDFNHITEIKIVSLLDYFNPPLNNTTEAILYNEDEFTSNGDDMQAVSAGISVSWEAGRGGAVSSTGILNAEHFNKSSIDLFSDVIVMIIATDNNGDEAFGFTGDFASFYNIMLNQSCSEDIAIDERNRIEECSLKNYEKLKEDLIYLPMYMQQIIMLVRNQSYTMASLVYKSLLNSYGLTEWGRPPHLIIENPTGLFTDEMNTIKSYINY